MYTDWDQVKMLTLYLSITTRVIFYFRRRPADNARVWAVHVSPAEQTVWWTWQPLRARAVICG